MRAPGGASMLVQVRVRKLHAQITLPTGRGDQQQQAVALPRLRWARRGRALVRLLASLSAAMGA
jgi:hypothetical protein